MVLNFRPPIGLDVVVLSLTQGQLYLYCTESQVELHQKFSIGAFHPKCHFN